MQNFFEKMLRLITEKIRYIRNAWQTRDRIVIDNLGPVVQQLTSADPRINFNLGFFGIIFSVP